MGCAASSAGTALNSAEPAGAARAEPAAAPAAAAAAIATAAVAAAAAAPPQSDPPEPEPEPEPEPQPQPEPEPEPDPDPEPEPEPEPERVGPCSSGHTYTLGQQLGEGSFGRVVKMERDDGAVLAAKTFSKATLKRKRMGWGRRTALDAVFEEIAVMKLLDHPNVLKLHEVMDDNATGKILIVLDYMAHGSCEPKEHGLEFFPEERARQYFNDTLLGLEELHNQGILHHDLKPENLLLTEHDQVKIGDLGIAQVCVPVEWNDDGVQHDDEELRRAEICTSWAGTPAFLAPEVASGQDSFDGAPVDIWALGVSLWHMTMDSMPFCESARARQPQPQPQPRTSEQHTSTHAVATTHPVANTQHRARGCGCSAGADSEYELYQAIADQPVVLAEDAPIR
jgi:serine/threonine protein kinase